ncbi:hypothetical protein Tco_1127419, partial [Tanacetum coccineum]
TLCKQGDWFSFAKRRAPSLVCVDDNHAAIDDPKPVAGSFNMADVHRLSAHVIKLRDIPEGVLVLSGLSRVWKNRFYDLVLRGADGNVMGIHDFRFLPEWTGADVDVKPTLQRLPFYCTLPAAADAVTLMMRVMVMMMLVLRFRWLPPIRYVIVIPPSGNQGRSSVAPTAKGSNTRDSRGKGIMVDDVAAPFGGVSRQRLSFGPAPLFRNVSGDAIHTDFFPFSAGPYYATYPEDGVAGNCEFTREEWDVPYLPTFGVLTKEVFKDHAICKTIIDQFPTPGEMVRVEGLSDDQLTEKISVLHCMMMSHGGELLARYHGLNQSHH